MEVVIVGHGPSLLTHHWGDIIDRYDKVIRLKRCQETLKHPEYYGTRTDIVGGSWTIAQQLKGIGKAREYWAFVDSRHEHINQEHVENLKRLFEPYELKCSLEECRFWDEEYRKMRRPIILSSQQKTGEHSSDGLGHNHLSQGLKAVIYAGYFLKPESITLAGFDNVVSGEFSWSITRGPEWQNYPDHHWAVEHELVYAIADHYGMGVNCLLPVEAEDEEVHNKLRT